MTDTLISQDLGDDLVVVDATSAMAYALRGDARSEYLRRRGDVSRRALLAGGVGLAGGVVAIGLPHAAAAASTTTSTPTSAPPGGATTPTPPTSTAASSGTPGAAPGLVETAPLSAAPSTETASVSPATQPQAGGAQSLAGTGAPVVQELAVGLGVAAAGAAVAWAARSGVDADLSARDVHGRG